MAVQKHKLTPDQMRNIAHALADSRRFAIMQAIASRTVMPCTEVCESQPIAPSTISHHVKELADAGLVEIKRTGRRANLIFRRDVWKAYLSQLSDI